MIAFALRPEADPGWQGSVAAGDGHVIIVTHALQEGNGVIVTDDETLINACTKIFDDVLEQVAVPAGALCTSHQISEPEGPHHVRTDPPPWLPAWSTDKHTDAAAVEPEPEQAPVTDPDPDLDPVTDDDNHDGEVS